MSLTPTHKQRFRRGLGAYCLEAELARLRWHYTRARPFDGFGLPASSRHAADCSAYVGLAFFAGRIFAGLSAAAVPDPLDERYSGWGYTGTMYAFLRRHEAPAGRYLIGDIAIFGTPAVTEHTSVCRKAGTVRSAIFSSNGHESWIFNRDAPEPISLAHELAQQHLIGVYRHPALL